MFAVASTIHCLLHNEYMAVELSSNTAGVTTAAPKLPLKRYWKVRDEYMYERVPRAHTHTLGKLVAVETLVPSAHTCALVSAHSRAPQVELWKEFFDTLMNSYGPGRGAADAALPGMLARGEGAFLHTCSAAGLLTVAGDAPYAVTKHAAVAFAEWLALTYGDRGIVVTALCPLGVETAMLGTDEVLATRFVRGTGRVLPADVVAVEALLALEEGRMLALPHPEVAAMEQARAADRGPWLRRLRRAVEALEA